MDNAAKMASLIDGLLSLARLTRSELKCENVNLTAMARSAVAALTARDASRTAEFAIAEGLRADLDPVLARSLVENLLDNAWKFTKGVSSPRIEFGTTGTGTEAAFF